MGVGYDLNELLQRVVVLMNAMNVNELTVCSPRNEFLDPSDDPVNCNIVRGWMLRVEKVDKDTYRVVEFYSHTATDCPDCDPSEIEELDRESERVIGTFKIENGRIVWM